MLRHSCGHAVAGCAVVADSHVATTVGEATLNDTNKRRKIRHRHVDSPTSEDSDQEEIFSTTESSDDSAQENLTCSSTSESSEEDYVGRSIPFLLPNVSSSDFEDTDELQMARSTPLPLHISSSTSDDSDEMSPSTPLPLHISPSTSDDSDEQMARSTLSPLHSLSSSASDDSDEEQTAHSTQLLSPIFVDVEEFERELRFAIQLVRMVKYCLVTWIVCRWFTSQGVR